MRSFTIVGLAAVCVGVTFGVGTTAAQFQPPPPPISPYINLLRRGSPAINYYGLVRPIMDQQAFNQQFLNNQESLQSYLSQQQSSEDQQPLEDPQKYPTTGHPTQTLNYGRYFLNRGVNAPQPTTTSFGTLPTPSRGSTSSGRR